MRIVVLGAGAIGSAVAYDLCQAEDVLRVKVCESRPAVLRRLREQVGSPKLRTYQTDARDHPTLEGILASADVVVSCVNPELNPDLARLSLRAGAHFVDLGGNEATVQQTMELADEAEQRSRWVVPNCGLAPGLVNVLCMRGVDAFDRVHAAHLRVGDVPQEPEPPFGYRLSYAAEKLIEDYTAPVTVLRGGALETVDPLTGVEQIEFDEGFGPMEAFHASGLVSTLPQDLRGRVQELECKALRYPGHAAGMRFVLGLGFGEPRTIDVRTHLTYRDVLVRQMRKRFGGPYRDMVLLRARIEGVRAGRPQTLIYEIVDRFDEATGFSAMQRCTGFSVAVTALLVGRKQVPGGGASPPERILPKEPFFDELARRGIHVTERWEDAVGETMEAGVGA